MGRDLAVERLTLSHLLAAKPHATMVAPFGPGVLIYRLAGKVFALVHEAEATVTLKCDPHLSEILREAHPGITRGRHVEARHWIAVPIDGEVEDAQIIKLVDQSYDLVWAKLTRAERAKLDAEPPEKP